MEEKKAVELETEEKKSLITKVKEKCTKENVKKVGKKIGKAATYMGTFIGGVIVGKAITQQYDSDDIGYDSDNIVELDFQPEESESKANEA